MRIALTYDLRSAYLAAGYSEEETAELDRDETIDALQAGIEANGHTVERVGNVRQVVAALAAGQRWDLVFNIAEGLRGFAREAQIPAVLDAYEIPYTFSDPLVMALSLHKGHTKTIIRAAGVATPDFALVRTAEEADAVDLPWPLFAKPVAEGTGKGVSPASRVASHAELRAVVVDLVARFQQEVLVETYLPGREFTIGVLGTGEAAKVLGTLEIVLLAAAEQGAYSYVNKENCEELVEYRFVTPLNDPQVAEAEAAALAAWRALGGRDGGRLDFRCDASGRPSFIEANPLAGLHPFHSDLPMIATAVGMPYHALLGAIIDSARLRQVEARSQRTFPGVGNLS